MLNNKPVVKISADADSVMLELNGTFDDVLTVGTTGYSKLLEACAEKLGKPGAMQKVYRAAIGVLESKLEALTGEPLKRCTCQAEAKPEEPAKRMTPEEFSDYYNAWMSQAPLAEKNRFLDLQMSQLARKVVESYLA